MDKQSNAGLILGGGIAGLAFAAAMHRLGQKTRLLEAADDLRANGSGVVLGPTAMMSLRRIGLREEVIASGQILKRGGLADLSMRPLAHDVFGYFGQRSGEPFVGIERSALIRILGASVPDCRTSSRYVSVKDLGDEVSVDLETGEQLQAPWAVLADGVRSVGRGAISMTTIRDAGQWCWRGIANGIDLGEHGNGFLEAWGSEWRYGFTPVGHGRTYWFVVQRAPARGGREEIAQSDRQSQLLAIAQRFPELITRLIGATKTEEILENRLEDLAPLRSWHSARLVCIGDAAHAMTPNLGQGATQSLEDAVILAKTICQGGSLNAVFSQFETLRRPRAERTVREARTIGSLAHCPGWAAPARNAVMRRLPRAMSIRQIAWLYEDRKLAAALA